MALVTLIGEKLAVEGNEFIYLGPQNDCRNCKLKTVCFNLKQNRTYKITNIRDKKHSCNIHEGAAAVVEVKEMPIVTTIDKSLSEGATTKIEKEECKNIGCKYYELCNVKIQKDKKYTIKTTYEKIDCPAGYNLQKAELSD
jgi:hypothetical protein